jgi:periplasmic copper chaperone A
VDPAWAIGYADCSKEFAMLKIILAALFSLTLNSAFAMEMAAVEVGSLKISKAFAKAMLPGQPAGAGYLVIDNTGTEADRLVSATSEASPDVEIHEMKMEGDIMKMRELPEGLEIPAGGTVELKPGGYHLMFMKVPAPFKEGETLKVKLKFEKAGEAEVMLPVGKAGPGTHGG